MAGEPSPSSPVSARTVIGLLVVGWGLLLTAGNLGWLTSEQMRAVLHFWPLALVAFGVLKFASATCRSGKLFGGLVALAGVWIFADEAFGFRVRFWEWWPLLLIAAGLLLVARGWDGPGRAAPRAPSDRAELAFWSGIERRITSQDFRRADVTAIMGGIELDLRGAAMAGSEATIEVFAMMGGIEITLPPDWDVVNRITPILGGVEDQSTGAGSSQHRLILEGIVIMGGVEVKT